MRRILVLPAITAVLLASPVAAQQRPLGGVLQPFDDVATGVHADAVEYNPAGLGFGNAFDLGYTFTSSSEDRPGQGHSLFTALGLDPYHTALGVQFLDPPGAQNSAPVKVSWGHALRLSPALSLGFAWHTFSADEDAALDGIDTWDVGLQIRPWRWVAAGMAINDINTPVLGGQEASEDAPERERMTLPRSYGAAVALRPGTERLQVTGTMRLAEEGDEKLNFGGRLALRLFGSIALIGRYDTTGTDDVDRSHQVMVGIADIGNFGAGIFYFAPDFATEGERNGVSATVRLRSRTEPLPELFPKPMVVEVAVESAAEYGPAPLFSSKPRTPFLDLLLTLRSLERNEEVTAVLLSFGAAELGWAQASELRNAIKRLRAAGKQVHAWLPVGDTRTYSVAAAADKVYTAPAGGLLLTGMRGELLYAGELLKRLGVKPQFVAIGDYKTAPELFTRSGPSPAAKQVQDSLLDDIYTRVVAEIAEGRGMTTERVLGFIDNGPYTAQVAAENGLVDEVVHYDEFDEVMRKALGERVRFARAADLMSRRDPRWGRIPLVGVLYAVGNITDGRSVVNPFTGAASTGAQTFIEAARELREDPLVRAVVLRVDSPGGSVTAADAMWRELDRLAEAKPLVVSMGDVAASGGYYVAAPGREILASPDTITGSIGVFTGKFDLSGLYWTLGLNKALFKRGKRAGILSDATSWTPDERAAVQKAMDALYDLFLDRVADGRSNLSKEQVAPLARGRVWTGQQARACGLVDRPEGLITAIDIAARAAGFGQGDYRLVVLPDAGGFGGLPTSPLGQLAAWISTQWGGVPETSALPEPLQRLLDVPLLAYESGTPLALLPFVWR